jgi:CDGSH-type Zn-finger protein
LARLIEHQRSKPYVVEAGADGKVYICACGLSKNKPMCDGSHKRAADEEPNALYIYDGVSRAKIEPTYT